MVDGWFMQLHGDAAEPWAGGGRPSLVLIGDADGHGALLRDRTGVVRQWDDPLAALAWMEQHALTKATAGQRWIGYLSYDLGRLFETLVPSARDDLRLPLFAFGLVDPGQPTPPSRPPAERTFAPGELKSSFDKMRYVRAVERCLEYIRAGDVFQVNLSQRFELPLPAPVETIDALLRERYPARFGATIRADNWALLCNSPELFLRIRPDDDGRRSVLTRPIKGTRPRQPGQKEALYNSVKDQAELNMIVDLERNDLGRICEIGSVRVSEMRTIETHPTVHHGVAGVRGILRPDVTFVDLLAATFPGGSITGAPKIRAMQIIEELEGIRRGPYCGAIGCLCPDGSIQLNVAIRTMIIKADKAYVPVGGGIVADSAPAEEYQETLTKAAAMFQALGLTDPPLR
jgi:para-aminobenzoate synthetase component 1